jgi:hypothetical protein
LLYAEHTFGYSRTQDSDLLSQQIFLRKSKHAIDADELASAALFSILHARGEGEFRPEQPFAYRIVNPLDVRSRAPVWLQANHWEQRMIQSGFQVVDARGRVYPHQTMPSARGTKTAVVVDLEPRQEIDLTFVPHTTRKPPATAPSRSFRNEFFAASWDEGRGITGVTDLASGLDLLDASAGALASPVYQLFPGGNRRNAGLRNSPRTRPREETSPGSCTDVRRVSAGPVFEQWQFRYDVRGAAAYLLTATFFRALPQFELTVSLEKTDVRDPEGMYVLFPLSVPQAAWTLDKPGHAIRPGRDQLPQTCCDYYCIQHGASLNAENFGIAVATLDAPMVQIGKLRLWTFSTSIDAVGPLYSWLTNNKWETNFKISCGGSYDFRYLVQAGRDLADPEAAIGQCRTLSYPPLVLRR